MKPLEYLVHVQLFYLWIIGNNLCWSSDRFRFWRVLDDLHTMNTCSLISRTDPTRPRGSDLIWYDPPATSHALFWLRPPFSPETSNFLPVEAAGPSPGAAEENRKQLDQHPAWHYVTYQPSIHAKQCMSLCCCWDAPWRCRPIRTLRSGFFPCGRSLDLRTGSGSPWPHSVDKPLEKSKLK